MQEGSGVNVHNHIERNILMFPNVITNSVEKIYAYRCYRKLKKLFWFLVRPHGEAEARERTRVKERRCKFLEIFDRSRHVIIN